MRGDLFGYGPNSIDPADRQDLRCETCDGHGELIVVASGVFISGTACGGDPNDLEAIPCPECGGEGFEDVFKSGVSKMSECHECGVSVEDINGMTGEIELLTRVRAIIDRPCAPGETFSARLRYSEIVAVLQKGD